MGDVGAGVTALPTPADPTTTASAPKDRAIAPGGTDPHEAPDRPLEAQTGQDVQADSILHRHGMLRKSSAWKKRLDTLLAHQAARPNQSDTRRYQPRAENRARPVIFSRAYLEHLQVCVKDLQTTGSEAYWQRIGWDKVKYRLPRMMLLYLTGPPREALNFLQGVLPFWRLHAYQVVDVFDFITRSLEGSEAEAAAGTPTLLLETLQQVIKFHKHVPQFTQRTLLFVLRTRPMVEIAGTVEALHSKGVAFGHDTLLQVSRLLATSGQPEAALRPLAIAVKAGAPVELEGVRRTAAKLIRESRDPRGDYERVTDTVSALLKLDIHLDLSMYNVLILNAAEAKDYGTAWRIWEILRANGIEPDYYTYTILMKMCRKMADASGRKAYGVLYRQLMPESRDHLDPHLVTEVLKCRFAFDPPHSFDRVLQFYERHCDLQPLKDLRMLPADYTSRYERWYTTLRPYPSTPTLGVVISAFLRACIFAKHMSRRLAVDLYVNFGREVREGNPAMLQLASTDHTYNAFIKAFSTVDAFAVRLPNWRRMTASADHYGAQMSVYWADILQAMQTPFAHSVVDPSSGAVLAAPKPTLRTWNTILNAISRRGNAAEAERILERMRSSGVEPNTVSWNCIIGGLARSQRPDRVADALDRMRAAKSVPDARTVAAVNHLRDQDAVLRFTRELTTGIRPGRVRRVASTDPSDRRRRRKRRRPTLTHSPSRFTTLLLDSILSGSRTPAAVATQRTPEPQGAIFPEKTANVCGGELG